MQYNLLAATIGINLRGQDLVIPEGCFSVLPKVKTMRAERKLTSVREVHDFIIYVLQICHSLCKVLPRSSVIWSTLPQSAVQHADIFP